MSSFSDIIARYDWQSTHESILAKTDSDVLTALAKAASVMPGNKPAMEDFKALISPAATPHLEHLAQLSQKLTQKRFGKTIQLYTPMYLSNECQNTCNYCGFSLHVDIPRKTLNQDEIRSEAQIIKQLGYDHILLVTGESAGKVGMDYFKKALQVIRPLFTNISMEVQPLGEADYRQLIGMGVNAVLVYQETYNKHNYRNHHPKGKKSNFHYRADTHDRLGRAGICKMGLGVLLGLEDWRTDSYFCALHLKYLQKKYWQSKYTISFPRIRPHMKPAGSSPYPDCSPSDRELIQLICAYRLLDENVELSLSTREHKHFRDHAIQLGITHLSADSRTNPGGHLYGADTLEQFEIDDNRDGRQIARSISALDYEPVWKDWFTSYN